ncbi:MAG: T9SS type A sorting domain-containing protein [Bacteroidota bacterium]
MKYTLLFAALAGCIAVHAQVIKGNNTGGSASSGAVTQIVNYDSSDFGPGITAANVQIGINWQGEDASNIFFNEAISVVLTSPSGTSVQLIQPRQGSIAPTYGYNAGALNTWGPVTTIFADNGASAASGTAHPMPGTWQPQNPLNAFIGESPIGDWELTISYINFLGTDVLNWSAFNLFIAGGLMPVELTKFEVKEMGNGQVQIDWQTASELDNDYFLLECSNNAKDWKSIAKVTGTGTSFDQVDYQFIDKSTHKGTIYYRLKQVDFDGTHEYSEIISLDLKSEKDDLFKVFPNPAEQFVTLENAVGRITIYNALNQVVHSSENEISSYQLDLNNLPKGQYIIQIRGKNNEIKEQRLIKL